VIFNEENKSLLLLERLVINSHVKPDPEIKKIVSSYYDNFEVSLNKVIGFTKIDLDARFNKIRTRETNVSNLIADIIRSETHCDVVLVNSGTLRADCIFPEGEIKLVYSI
jgi:2',3'-cyclic-nucleotide 2'-phosphodiesterase (5'-nucleotidase family)